MSAFNHFANYSANHARNRSLLRQVLGGMSIVLLILAILGGSYAFWNSYREVSHFQDDNLKNIARLIADNNITTLDKLQHYQTADNDGGLSIDVLPNAVAQNTPANPAHTTINDQQLQTIPQGLSSQVIAGETWQVYRLDKGDSRILVRQRIDLQDDLAETSAIQSLLPLLLAIVTLGLLLSYIIWQMFRPVEALATTVSTRQDFDLSPLPLAGLPKEILPFVTAINQLLTQVKTNVEQQQRFIADASHELRSPLTAISLQLQRLQRLATEPKLQDGLNKLATRVQRNQDLVEQLLTLARLNAHPEQLESVALSPIIEQTVNLLLPIIDHKAIALRVHIAPPFERMTLHADATALTLLIKNLVQNAVLYTPAQGEVSIVLQAIADCPPKLLAQSHAIVNHTSSDSLTDLPTHTPLLQIIDTGIGIDPVQYQQAFEPFVRLTPSNDEPNRSDNAEQMVIKGTGLGLAMVKSICEQTGISLFLAPSIHTVYNPTPQQGLAVSLIFPSVLPTVLP